MKMYHLTFEWGTGCGKKSDYRLTEYINIASLAEPTKSECSLKIGLFEETHHKDFTFIAWDLVKTDENLYIKSERWHSQEFRIYNPNCTNPTTSFDQEGEYNFGFFGQNLKLHN